MEERILVHRNPEYQKWLDFYKYRVQELQDLVNGMKQLSIEPTLENLKRLLNGEELHHLTVETDIEKHLSFLPKRLKASLKEAAAKELKEEYQEQLGKKVEIFTHEYQNKYDDIVSLGILCKNIEINDGIVSMTEDCYNDLDRSFNVYIDTPGRKAVYEAYLKFMDAYNELEKAIKEAPKTPNQSYMGQTFGDDHNSLRALGVYNGSYSLIELNGGELDLIGNRFSAIQ